MLPPRRLEVVFTEGAAERILLPSWQVYGFGGKATHQSESFLLPSGPLLTQAGRAPARRGHSRPELQEYHGLCREEPVPTPSQPPGKLLQRPDAYLRNRFLSPCVVLRCS